MIPSVIWMNSPMEEIHLICKRDLEKFDEDRRRDKKDIEDERPFEMFLMIEEGLTNT